MQRHATVPKIPLHGSKFKWFKRMSTQLKSEIVPVFNYKNRELLPGEYAPVHVRVYLPGVSGQKPLRKYLQTGISLQAHEWDEENRRANARNPNSHHINKVLRDFVASIEDYEYRLITSGQRLTAEALDEYIRARGAAHGSFTEFFYNEIDPALKRGTRKEHHYTYHLLKEFRPSILFSEVNLSLIQEFDRFMRAKGLSQNTIYKHHQHLNRFLRLASLKERFPENKNPYRNFKLRKEQGSRTSLTVEELSRIESLTISDAYPDLQLVRNLFLFSCYTGLRFSDIVSLLPEHILQTPDGPCIVKKMEKVPKPVTLPLELLFAGKPKAIIDPFLAVAKPGRPVFPCPSNQHVNRQLKVLAQLAGVSMRLTFHVARHTFGTMLAELTQNPYLIMDLMGHADIQTSMIYIHRSQERINRQLRNVTW